MIKLFLIIFFIFLYAHIFCLIKLWTYSPHRKTRIRGGHVASIYCINSFVNGCTSERINMYQESAWITFKYWYILYSTIKYHVCTIFLLTIFWLAKYLLYIIFFIVKKLHNLRKNRCIHFMVCLGGIFNWRSICYLISNHKL